MFAFVLQFVVVIVVIVAGVVSFHLSGAIVLVVFVSRVFIVVLVSVVLAFGFTVVLVSVVVGGFMEVKHGMVLFQTFHTPLPATTIL